MLTKLPRPRHRLRPRPTMSSRLLIAESSLKPVRLPGSIMLTNLPRPTMLPRLLIAESSLKPVRLPRVNYTKKAT